MPWTKDPLSGRIMADDADLARLESTITQATADPAAFPDVEALARAAASSWLDHAAERRRGHG